MKTIKTFLLAGLAAVLLTTPTSCTDYQDEIDALDGRVAYLESLVDKVNDNLTALQKIVNTITNSGYITGITETSDGCIINVEWIKQGPDGKLTTTSESFIVRNGKKGKDGEDATMPNITVEQDPTDGNYYWKLNGDWLTGPDGQRVKANGKDGKDGVDGTSGKDGITPQVRIIDGYWEVSTDGGKTWTKTGTPAQGNDGNDGKDGKDASPIVKVVTHWNEGFVEFLYADGSGFKVPLHIASSTNN